jgi:hypothetical protein
LKSEGNKKILKGGIFMKFSGREFLSFYLANIVYVGLLLGAFLGALKKHKFFLFAKKILAVAGGIALSLAVFGWGLNLLRLKLYSLGMAVAIVTIILGGALGSHLKD